MSTLLERSVRVNRIVTTSIGHARAIEDPARAKIIEILYHKSMSAEQISNELKKHGHKKALTTVRHHLDILKESGLIEISKIIESRGAMTKFYSTATRLLGYDAPDDFESNYSNVINKTSVKIEKILQNIPLKVDKKTKSDDYSQYLLLEIMNRAITNVLESRN